MENGLKDAHERGASSVEYGLLIAGIAAIIVLALFGFGDVALSMFDSTCDTMDPHFAENC